MLRAIYHWIKLRFLGLLQDQIIFKPGHGKLDKMKNPEEYGLSGAKTVDIKTEDGAFIHLWVKEPDEDKKPLFVVFHGNTGHFGDVGKPKSGELHDARYRIKLLKTILETGSGIVAVSLRGFGKSSRIKPSEEGFIKDVKAVTDFVLLEKGFQNDRVIILGESLGASIAMIMAEAMTLIDKPPALVAKIAAFSSLKWKVIELHPDLSEQDVERSLKHRFDSEERLKNLKEATHLFIMHPEDDQVTGKFHSKKLADLAKEAGLLFTHKEITGGHITWDANEVVSNIMETYDKHIKTLLSKSSSH